MSALFDNLEDETPPTIGEEIGAALSAAVSDISKSNEAMAAMIAKSIAEALRAADSRRAIGDAKPSVKKWIFKTERDSKGLLSQVIATAEF